MCKLAVQKFFCIIFHHFLHYILQLRGGNGRYPLSLNYVHIFSPYFLHIFKTSKKGDIRVDFTQLIFIALLRLIISVIVVKKPYQIYCSHRPIVALIFQCQFFLSTCSQIVYLLPCACVNKRFTSQSADFRNLKTLVMDGNDLQVKSGFVRRETQTVLNLRHQSFVSELQTGLPITKFI